VSRSDDGLHETPVRSIQRRRRHALAAGDSVTLLEDDLPKPAGKRRRLAQVGQAAVRFDERLLRRVLGPMEIAQHREREAVRHVLESADNLAVRVQVARPGAGHQLC